MYCSCYQLTPLDVSNKTKLTDLSCGGNQLTTLDVSKTKLNEYGSNCKQLRCKMASLQTLYLKTGWQLEGINKNRDTDCIHPNTRIEYKD